LIGAGVRLLKRIMHNLIIIIGTGPGGIALAAEAAPSGIMPAQVLVLEKGASC
jgi:flavin-dependent dehydrogenase